MLHQDATDEQIVAYVKSDRRAMAHLRAGESVQVALWPEDEWDPDAVIINVRVDRDFRVWR